MNRNELKKNKNFVIGGGCLQFGTKFLFHFACNVCDASWDALGTCRVAWGCAGNTHWDMQGCTGTCGDAQACLHKDTSHLTSLLPHHLTSPHPLHLTPLHPPHLTTSSSTHCNRLTPPHLTPLHPPHPCVSPHVSPASLHVRPCASRMRPLTCLEHPPMHPCKTLCIPCVSPAMLPRWESFSRKNSTC